MPNQKILYITTEMYPYQEDSAMGSLVHRMALKSHAEGNDVRVFMPRFGHISERRYQLHEVIRLSGMNLIVNDLDQPLIIKVASLPGERLQVYFIDNEEYFKRKAMYHTEEGQPFPDLAERAIFFARGVIETIKKLNWVPDVIHLNGWMAALVPIYLQDFYKNDLYFQDSKIVMSVYNEEALPIEESFPDKLKFDKITRFEGQQLSTTQDLVRLSFPHVQHLVLGDEFLEGDIKNCFEKSETPTHDYTDENTLSSFYEKIKN